MSYSISTLLTRNLQEVFGENDPARRRAAVQELYTEDGVFYDPSKGVYRGREEIDQQNDMDIRIWQEATQSNRVALYEMIRELSQHAED